MTPVTNSVALDEYSRHARLKPAFLVVLPVGMLVSVLGLSTSVMLAAFSGPLATVGLTFLLAQIGRDFGKRKESHLYSLWGGKPSVAKMRHRDTTINAHTRERYYRKAESLLSISIPDAPSEQTDPSTSDALYEAYSNLLLERTRDRKKFPLVFQELTNYGFRRNLWGMKPIGLSLTLLCAAGQLVSVIHSLLVHRTPSAFTISCLLVTSFLLVSWLFIINPGWVKLAGDAYAERLLASAEMLQAPVAPVPAGKRNPPPRRAKSVS
jgi:hypothetical protein